MDENIGIQIYIFLFTLYGGLILGILYDIIDILLYGKGKKTRGRGITDILFWLLAIMVVLGILFYSNNGDVRVYTLLGFAIGWLLYFWLLSPWIRRLIFYLVQGIVMIIKGIIAILLIPFTWAKRIISIPMMKIQNKGENMKKQVTKYFQLPKIIIEQFKKYRGYFKKKK